MLVITIIIIIILATITINAVVGDNGLIYQARSSKDMSSNEIAETEGSMNNLFDEYANIMAEDSETPGIPTLPTDGSFNSEKGVNTPKLENNMELIRFAETQHEWVEDETNSEYSYIAGSGTSDNTVSHWANAKVTIDGVESYFVWIPRYAYKITYYTDESKTTESTTKTAYGTIDVKFIKGTGKIAADGTECKYASESPNATQEYVIHPAFTTEAEYGGGWDVELAGIWIGKYEASSVEGNSDSSTGDNVTTKTVKVQPGVSSWRNITIGNMYTVSKNYARNLKSHMLKNSEWGAVAYLTDSKYGRNGTEIGFGNQGYITGGGTEKSYVENIDQSSTGNVYGVYDLRGVSYGRVAGYYSGGNSNYLNNGLSFTSTKTSDEYSTVYSGTVASTAYKYGDATYETNGWHRDYNEFVNSNYPFFDYGGYYINDEGYTGIFCNGLNNGSSDNRISFRLALVV